MLLDATSRGSIIVSFDLRKWNWLTKSPRKESNLDLIRTGQSNHGHTYSAIQHMQDSGASSIAPSVYLHSSSEAASPMSVSGSQPKPNPTTHLSALTLTH
jgi:hypothetical protein